LPRLFGLPRFSTVCIPPCQPRHRHYVIGGLTLSVLLRTAAARSSTHWCCWSFVRSGWRGMDECSAPTPDRSSRFPSGILKVCGVSARIVLLFLLVCVGCLGRSRVVDHLWCSAFLLHTNTFSFYS
jgi:hypothetical protein